MNLKRFFLFQCSLTNERGETNEKFFFFLLICSASVLLTFANVASAQPHAICVPWQPSSPLIAHYTYNEANITLKGIARGLTGVGSYEWDFGDGSPTESGTISDPYNLGVQHSYVGSAGDLFIATLTVSDSTGTHQDKYRVMIYESSDLSIPGHLDVRINMAIDEGLWYLHTNIIRSTYAGGSPGYAQPYGYWSDGYPLAATGAAVDAFQLHGSKANTDYDSDPYVETVQRALNYILYNTYSFPIGIQPAGDPDTFIEGEGKNGKGLVANHSSSLTDGRQTYIGGICMVALASSGAPNREASVGGDNVHGRTYAEIVQDMVDFFAWGQSDLDPAWARGGWRYYANSDEADMSTTQWPALGMIAAEENMGSTVPQFVRDELMYFLVNTQHTGLDTNNGGFGYSVDINMPNITKAAAGIICHEFLGTSLTDPRVESAIGFIYRHWNDTGTCWDYTKLLGNSYGMYGLMKAMRIPQPDILAVTEYDYIVGAQTANSFDWYYTPAGQTQQGLASYTVATQQVNNGSWNDNVGCNQVYNAFATGWRVLVLLKGVTTIPPNAVICDCDEQEYNLNQDVHLSGACSNHPDITRHIISYEWDLDGDGEFDDATGIEATIPGGFAETGYYPVSLRVTDDNPEGAQTSTYVCEVYVHPPPHCPHAFAGGPYIGWVGGTVTFDASASWDPDNEIVLYEWDFNNDGVFDFSGANSTATHTWNTPYFGVVRLRITDAAGEFEACSDEDSTTVEIGNHAPVSDPNGPYFASADSCITLDGTASYDPDAAGGDIITYAWDLDNDGEFDDDSAAQPSFCVGAVIGTVYDVCLKVTDSSGETDISCTTVEVSPNLPPGCSEAAPTVDIIWPPNHKFVAVNVIGVTDPDGDQVSITIDSIYQDEPVDTFGDGSFTPDGQAVGTDTAEVRAERSGTKKVPGNGRVYHISFTADDGRGGSCSGEVLVGVPHDMGKGKVPIDDGPIYDSTALAP